MDRALKERIIGAVVIVLFVVLVVPVFLDGRSGETEIVSERVPLPGQSEQESQTIVLKRDRDDPVPAVVNSAPTNEPKPEIVAEKPAPDPAPVKEEPVRSEPEPPQKADNRQEADSKTAPATIANAVPAAVSATGMWAVQIGAFSDQGKAERLAADLRKQGFAAFLRPLATGGGQLHRVRIGPQKDRQSAEAMAERLKKAGHSGQVVPYS